MVVRMTWLLVIMILITLAMGLVTLAVITVNNMTFDDVVDDTAQMVKQIPNQSSRVIGQFIEGGP